MNPFLNVNCSIGENSSKYDKEDEDDKRGDEEDEEEEEPDDEPKKDIHQGSFDHVKVRPTTVLVFHNLWRQMHMFLDILEFRVENQKNYLE